MSDKLISLKNVSFFYDAERIVLDDLNFDLAGEQRVHLDGANGSGKTTLLHLMVGLQRPTAGEVIILGRFCCDEADFRQVRRRVGLVFQDADDQLFCPTVQEDVAFGPLNLGKSRPQTREIVAQTLKSLGLEGYEERITHKLSGGEKRLISLACVLAMEPEVLLLDEPTAGLDTEITQKIIHILNDLSLPMVVVSHDRDLIRSVSNKAVKLQDGKIT